MPHETASRRYLGLAGFMVIPLVSIRQKFRKTNNKFQINHNDQTSKSQIALFYNYMVFQFWLFVIDIWNLATHIRRDTYVAREAVPRR